VASLVPYATAKAIFTVLSFAALMAAVFILWRAVEPSASLDGRRVECYLALLAMLFTAYPVLLLLERGQVDGFTFLLLVLAFRPVLEGRTPGVRSGALLALATLLKLNAVYFGVFWALRRFWRGILGLAAGGALLLAASLLLDGPTAIHRYLTVEMKRIAAYGEGGTEGMRLPPETLAHLRGDSPAGFVRREGRLYRLEGVGFAANASGARVLARALGLRRPRSGVGPLSLLIVACSAGLAAWAMRGRSLAPGAEELAWFTLALSAVLLAGPLTWAMNVVWLVAGGVLLAVVWPAARPREVLSLVGLALGLLLAWMPDQYALGWLFASPPAIGDYKYVTAEVLILASLVLWLRARTASLPASERPA
jgi:Glycosyltransferase family 87